MTALESIVDYMRAIPKADIDRAEFMAYQVQSIPGWSGPLHYLFFEAALRFLPVNPSILVCGVYHGRDLKLISMAAKFLGRSVQLTGVDRFANEPCADWTEAQRKIGSWELNGFGYPPSYEAAMKNCPEARIIKADSVDYMRSVKEPVNLIYLDTSHDWQTLSHEISMAKYLTGDFGLVSGDDYEGEPHWDVQRAVDEAFSSRAVFGNTIWLVQP